MNIEHTNQIKLMVIRGDGSFDADFSYRADEVEELSAHYAAYYKVIGYLEPWVGYFAAVENEIAGVCGFKGEPSGGRVEVAYFVFPRFEGRGIATAMVQKLVKIALENDSRILVSARTLPESSASTRVLEKAGFRQTAAVSDPGDGPVWEWLWEK